MNHPGRASARHRHAGAGVPDVRDRGPGRGRAHASRSSRRSSASCGRAFSEVAAANPYAWIREAKTAEEIRTPRPTNRMIGFPYTKYMNSNNDVDMGAALIMCSVEKAQALGIPRDRWVFPHSRRRLPRAQLHQQPVALRRDARHRAGRPPRARAGRRRASTTSRSSTSTRASRPRCSSARRASGCRSIASSRAPAACRSPAARGTTTSCTPSPR